MPHGPNRPERLEALNPDPSHLDPIGSGEIMQDGFHRCARRPRVRGYDETVDTSTADTVEAMLASYDTMPYR